MKEFYNNNRLAFHLDIITKSDDTYSIVSNIPKELTLSCISKMEDKLDDDFLFQGTKVDFVHELGNHILNNENSRYFFYPSYLFNGDILLTETWEEILHLGTDFIVKPDDYFGESEENIKLYILSVIYQKCRLYHSDDFKKDFSSISRKEFEDAINCHAASADYVKLYSQDNQFLKSQEMGYTLYFSLSNFIPQSIIVTR